MNRLCSDLREVPDWLLRSWPVGVEDEEGCASGESGETGRRRILSLQSWIGAGPSEQVNQAVEAAGQAAGRWSDAARRWVMPVVDDEWQPASSSSDAAGAASADRTSQAAQAGSSDLDRGATEIRRYLFADEGKEKGTVKVYVKAQEIEGACGDDGTIDAFDEVHVDFQERSLFMRAMCRDGRVFVLRAGHLFGPVCPGECRYTLSSTGHKVSITLKKADTQSTWHRLTQTPGAGNERVALDVKDFI
mmetsp:Transcript_43674/g.98644  ORF Transcript_43674/g.98644 Transcript_43674/m.98644 type:complete len:247 (-) Transcript_43674:56-796(-)